MRKLLIGLLLALAFTTACSDADRAHWSALGNPAIIEIWSGGKIIATFESTGKVSCTEGGICDFMDRATRRLVRTTGDIIVRVQ